MIKKLNITKAEMQSGFKTIIDTREKYDRNNKKRRDARRDENGLLKDEKRVLDLKDAIVSLKKQKVKNKDIAEQLNTPLKTIERHITALKKEGRL